METVATGRNTGRSYGCHAAEVKQIVRRQIRRRDDPLRLESAGSVAYGKHRKLHAVGNTQLAIDATQVVFHRLNLESHPGGDLPVRTSHRDEGHDLTFTGGQ